VEHLWQTTVCVVFGWALTMVLWKNSAAVRHWIWFFASLKFLVPFSLLVSIGDGLQPVVPAPIPEAPLAAFVRASSTIASLPDMELLATPDSSNALPTVLVVPWFLGAVLVAGSWLKSWHHAAKLVRAAMPVRSSLPLQVRISPDGPSPSLVGILRPVLLLPAGIREKLSPNQLRALLVHELAHLRRRDNLLAVFHMTVEILFWFHPVVWWIGRRLSAERERACDEAVLRKLQKPRVYAEGILAVCRMYKEETLANLSGITHSNLPKRIEGIVSPQNVARMGLAKRGLLAIAAMSVIGLPVLLGLVRVQPMAAQSIAPLLAPAQAVQSGQTENRSRERVDHRPKPSPQPQEVTPAAATPREVAAALPIIRNKTFFFELFEQQAATPQETAPTVSTPAQNDYVLGVADELDIHVWREPELSRRVVIRPDGKISLPLVNDIHAAGLTPMQLGKAVAAILGLRLTDPSVTVIVAHVGVRSLSVTITGNVRRPGEYSIPGPVSLVELIARAGGFQEFAKVKQITVIRQQNDVTTRYLFSYDSYLDGTAPNSNITLSAGDIVLVP
jgi:beta-lactamase regulating signal transducer with metallopeptidase domain/protein involved in polysaccharide export with SLBB domain